MNLFSTVGLISTIALFLPILLLSIFRLSFYRSFPALFFYYLIVFFYNLFQLGYIPVSREVTFYHGTISNLLDAPLILLFLTYFSKTVSFRKKLLTAVGIFMIFEIVVLALYGLTLKATTVILAPGLFLIVCLSAVFFFHQVKIAVVYHKAIGKAIMIASILFAYCGFSFVYAVFYLVETPYKNDVHLVLFLIQIITSVTMAIGIFAERKRVRQIEELQTARKELKEIYNNDEIKTAAPPIEATIFKFDTKQWN